MQWIVDAYTLVFAGLLLPAGALGDRYGRKGVLVTGLVLFGGAAAAALVVDDPTTLIGLRAVMGAGAAAVMPVTLSIITTSFPPEERGRAVGVWVGIVGGGAVLGLFASGFLLEFFSWSSFFSLNVTLAALALIGALAVVPDSSDPHLAPLDPAGAVLSLAGIAGLVFGIIEGPERGWSDPYTLAAFFIAVVALPAFVWWELRRDAPLLDPRLFRLRGFGTGSLSLTVQFFAAFGCFFIAMQYLQYVAELSPLQSATALLPMPFVLIPLARKAPDLAERFGLNRVGGTGLALMAVGMLMLTRLTVDFSYWVMLAGLLPFAAGMALAGTPATTAIVSSLPASKQGVASAVNDTSREVGSALGIALLGSVLNEGYRSGVADAIAGLPVQLPPSAVEGAESSIAFVKLATVRHGAVGDQLLAGAKAAFVDATNAAMAVAAGILLLGALYVAWRGPRHDEGIRGGSARQTEPQGAEHHSPLRQDAAATGRQGATTTRHEDAEVTGGENGGSGAAGRHRGEATGPAHGHGSSRPGDRGGRHRASPGA